MAGQPGSLLRGRAWDLAQGGGTVDIDRPGEKYRSVVGLIKGLVREPFMPCQRLETDLEPSSPVNPLAKAALS